MKTDFVLYRMPYAEQAYRIDADTTHLLSSAEELDGVCGFVMAPFQTSASTPIVVIEGKSVPVPMASMPSRVAVDEHCSREQYASDFARFHEAICQGHFSKLVLSRCASFTSSELYCPEQLFAEACRSYPRMMIALVCSEVAGTWLMATPEILLALDGYQWRTMALAGTMAWEGKKQYEWSEKNKKEQSKNNNNSFSVNNSKYGKLHKLSKS